MATHRSSQGRLSEAWVGLSARERNLLRGLAITAVVMAGAVLFYFRETKLSKGRKQVDELREAVRVLHGRGSVYKEKLREREAREAQISATPIMFSSLLEEAANKVEGVTATNEETQAPVDLEGGLRKQSVEFQLRAVTLAHMTEFLANLEARPGHVIFAESLKIFSSSGVEDRITADVTLASWQRVVEDAKSGEKGDKAAGGGEATP